MATGSISISLTLSPTETVLKGRDSVSAVISGKSGSLPSGATITGGSLRFTSIAVYPNNGILYWTVTDSSDSGSVYAQTGSMSQQSAGFARVNFETPFDASSILGHSVGSYIGLHFYGVANSNNAFNLKNSSCTLVIDYSYEESSQYSASTGSLNKNSVSANGSDTITLSISGSTSVLNHQAVWRFGSYSSTTTVSVGGTSATLTPPTSWCNAVPNATSGTASVELISFYGSTRLGSYTYSFTITVPDSVVPTLGNPTATGSGTMLNGRYIQGKSKVTITSGTASGSYSSTIRSYSITGPNLSYSGSSNSALSDFIQSSGTLTYTVTVVDSRGRTASKTVQITVYEYSAPTIINYSAIRTNSQGTASESGTSILVYCECACSSINGQNSVTWSWQYKTVEASSWTNGASGLTSGSSSRVNGIASTSASYQIKITATDSLGQYAYVITALAVAGTVMFFKKGGTGIGFGTKTVKSDAKTFEVANDWVMYHGDNKIPAYVVSSTQPTGSAGLLWLKPVS